MLKLIAWLSDKALPFLVTFLIIFIPLYPKLPLIGVTHTWVYIRVEDIIIGLTSIVWLISLVFGKSSIPKNISFPIFVYWIVGFLSTVIALIFIFPTIANVFPFVALLHYFRRIEYLILFFIAASTVKKPEDINKYIIAICLAMLGVTLYGFGQRFLGLPAFLTMNEEFAKGIPLYLPPGARITSTFGGHYDFAAYLVLIIALLGSIFFAVKRMILKMFILILCVGGLSVLLLTASRVSFAVYLVTIVLMLIMQKKKLLIIPVVIFSVILLAQVKGTADRFAKTFRIQPIVINTQTGQPIAVLEKLPPEISGVRPTSPPVQDTLPLGTGFIGFPPVSENQPEATSVAVIKKPVSSSLKLATISSEISTISGSFLIQKAFVYDISFTTRLQGGWPRAWNAFLRNPLTGSGYSSISLASDNDYLRLLGETGILGFMAFLFIFTTYFIVVYRKFAAIKSSMGKSFVIGMTAGIIGLSLNAFLIDVFEASKVAYILWILIGITIGIIECYDKSSIKLWQETYRLLKSNMAVFFYLFLITIFIYGKTLNYYFVSSDFVLLKIAAQSKFSDVLQYFIHQYDFSYQPLSRLLYFIVYAIFWLKPFGYHFISLLLLLFSSFMVYLIGQKILHNKFLAFLATCIYLFMPFNNGNIVWISSYSIMLATVFSLLAFYFYHLYCQNNKLTWIFFGIISYICAFLSNEMAIFMPVLLAGYGFIVKGGRLVFVHKKYYMFFLFIAFLYLILHYFSGAKRLLDFDALVKLYGTSLITVFIIFLIKKICQRLVLKPARQNLAMVLIIFVLILRFNYDLAEIFAAWETAAKISHKIIYAVKDNYRFFPKKATLYFVNIPNNYKKAQVFSEGLAEAIWFVYRDDSLSVVRTNTPDDAFKSAEKINDSHVFSFDNNELTEVVYR
jgi:hypothetical protein